MVPVITEDTSGKERVGGGTRRAGGGGGKRGHDRKKMKGSEKRTTKRL